MEMVTLSSREPTHRVTHIRRRLDVFIYIAPSLVQKLESRNSVVRQGAEASVAINFREACRQQHGFIPGRFIEFNDLDLVEIDRSPQDPYVRMSHGGDPIDDED